MDSQLWEVALLFTQHHSFPGQFGSPPQQGGFASFNAFGAPPAAPAQNTFDPFGSTAPQPVQQAQPGFAAFGTSPPRPQQQQPAAQPQQQQASFFDAFGSPPASSGGFNAFAAQSSSGGIKIQWNPDITMYQGTGKFTSFYQGIVLNKSLIQ